jgi:hypothetical protein
MFAKYCEYLLEKRAFISMFEGYTTPSEALKDKVFDTLGDVGVSVPPSFYAKDDEELAEVLRILQERKESKGGRADKPEKEVVDPDKEKVPPRTMDFSPRVSRKNEDEFRRRDADFPSGPPSQKAPDRRREY